MVGAHGTVAFFPMLAPLFGGAASFDDGGLSLTAFLAAGGATAVGFEAAWQGMREEVAAGGVTGPLGMIARDAGRGGVRRLQHMITVQREERERRRLHHDMLALPVEDRARVAYISADRFSTQLITCVPTPHRRASDAEFREMLCT